MKLPNLLKLFTREVVTAFQVPAYIMYSVDNFNKWFNSTDNGATYANPGIFLRIDKLSEDQVIEYLVKCYGVTDDFTTRKNSSQQVKDLYAAIRKDWQNKSHNKPGQERTDRLHKQAAKAANLRPLPEQKVNNRQPQSDDTKKVDVMTIPFPNTAVSQSSAGQKKKRKWKPRYKPAQNDSRPT